MQADPRTADRVSLCGWFARAGVVEIRSIGGSVYPAQLIVCARPWVEPVCSSKIRARKAAELENLISIHHAAGGGISFGTFTLEHHAPDPLENTLAALRHAWDKTIHCNRWERVRKAHNFMGLVLAYEFTHGSEGWHPHLHVLWFHQEPLDARGLVDVAAAVQDRWHLGAIETGRNVHPVHGSRLIMNAQGTDLGGYVAKVQEGDWTVAQEMTRTDAKAARAGSRTPFSILRDHYAWGDLADWKLWQEFGSAILLGGNRSIPLCRMSPGLRKSVLGNQAEPALGDEQLALVEVGGVIIAVIPAKTWMAVRQSGLGAAVLAAGESGGIDGINELLTANGLGSADPPPLPLRTLRTGSSDVTNRMVCSA